MRSRLPVYALLAPLLSACAHAPTPPPESLPPRISLTTAGAPLCGYRLGGGDGPVFVYLHGGPGYRSADFVRSVGARLAAEGTLLAFDQRGAGCSPRGDASARYTIEAQTADVAEVIRRNAGRKVILVGHSYGGLLATHVALAYPDLVAGLALLDAPLDIGHAIDTLVDRCAARARAEGREDDARALSAVHGLHPLTVRLEAIGQHAPTCTGALLVPAGNHPTEGEVEAADARAGYTEPELANDGALSAQVFTEWPGRLRLPEGALVQLTMPVVAIWGERDPYYPAPEQQRLPTVVLPGAGHHTYREQPDRVAQAIVELARRAAAR